MYMTTVPLAEARAHLSRMVDEAVRTHERVEITRNGRREAVLLSADDFDVLTETLDILSDGELVQEIRSAIEESAEGDVLTTDDILEGMRAAGRATPDDAGRA